ncbi:polysaccharide deacetylase family protein [Sulfuricurvum sp.]|uniref:polysaccharide deacetylase family protein n=1 Tax=Sulfuricurvum sp. TaxID=2025608 RepID=UPI003C38D2DB
MFKSLLLSTLLFASLGAQEPAQWGENVTGVVTRFQTGTKEIALTLDACGGSPRSSQYDAELIDFLIQNRIPATLFINARWIDTNPEIFARLATNPLFEIGNHGTEHRPLSVNGKSVYNIAGTASAEEVTKEIEGNSKKIEKLTGKRPAFFRSGTAYYDEIAVDIAHKTGVEIGGFAIIADAGATLPSDEVSHRIKNARSGDIIIAHMNHPESGTREGIIDALTALRKEGFSFVRLSDVKQRLKRVE